MHRLLAALLGSLLVMLVAPAGADSSVAPTAPAAAAVNEEACGGGYHAGQVVAHVGGATPVAMGTCRGVRPGAQIVVANSRLCTLNFRFSGRDAQGRRHAYMGTAGHCAFEQSVKRPVQQVWGPGHGPLVTDARGQRIGTFAYAIHAGDRDFGLVRLDAGVRVSPQMCHFGGPTGVNRDVTSRTTVLRFYGQGLGLGFAAPARSAVAQGMPHEGHIHAAGAVMVGDSGAGVTSSDGRAVGLVITTGVHGGQIGTSGVDVGTVGIARLGPVANRAATALHQRLTLHTAPRR